MVFRKIWSLKVEFLMLERAVDIDSSDLENIVIQLYNF